MRTNNKKIFIVSLGCPRNQVDSELYLKKLAQKGFIITDNPRKADVIIINTCGFIKEAKEESIDYILNYLKFKKKIIVTGCLVNRYKEKLKKLIPEVENFYTITEFYKFLGIDSPETAEYIDRPILTDNSSFAFVRAGDGCYRKCSFCAIPIIKPVPYSRKINDIIEEIKWLLSRGIKEIILVSQDLINFGIENNEDLIELLKQIEKITEFEFRYRLLYLFPDRKLIEIVKLMKKSSRLCKYIDLPIQHASNKILQRMNRPYNKKFCISLIEEIRNILPEIVIRSTFITGFPGETEEEHNELKHFLEEIKLNWAGFYIFSREEGTEAWNFTDRVHYKTAQKRLRELYETQKDITHKWLSSRINKIYRVLTEGVIENNYYYGRTEFEAPEIDGNVIFFSQKKLNPGSIVNVKITDVDNYDLKGIAL